ncbi:hypothetical protein TNCV_270971 [Trichonephila clavipes]|nr:hypothetical protein TNCV_270971 [Trichonephila clavipes]
MKEGWIALNYENVLNVMSEWDYTNERVLFLDGFERRFRMDMFDHYLAEYLWPRSHDYSLNDEAFKAFYLKSAVMLYPPLGTDQQ